MNKPSTLSVRDTISFEANSEQEKQRLEQRRQRRGIDSGLFTTEIVEKKHGEVAALLFRRDRSSLAETTIHDTEVFNEIFRTLVETSSFDVTVEQNRLLALEIFKERCGRLPILREIPGTYHG